MGKDGLFEGLPEVEPVAKAAGKPRLRQPVRDQIELRAVDLEALIGADHPARTIWAYVEQLDFSALEEMVRARTHTAGTGAGEPEAAVGVVAVRHEPGGGQRPRAGQAVHEP